MSYKIPPSFIDDVLSRIDIVSIIERHIPLKKGGANYLAICPFHQEKTPSFSVSPSKQLYYCFGCGAGGNAINFLMDYERLSFLEAVEALAKEVGIELPKEMADTGPVAGLQPHYDVLQQSADFYHKQLMHAPGGKRALSYLQSRGLSEKVIQQFNIGYAPAGWDHLLRQYTDRTDVQHLLKSGMLVERQGGGYYDRFRDRVMFPIRDRRGRVIAFGGRVLNDELPKYLNSPETPVFHKSQALYGLYSVRQVRRNIKQILVVEGYMDVVSLAAHGIDYAVATLGTATSAYHIQSLFRVGSEVVFCFDGDAAGRKAAWHALEQLLPIFRDDWRIEFSFLPQGEDPDTLVQKKGKESFENLLKNSLSVSEFFFKHLMTQVDVQRIDGLAQLTSLAKPYLQKLPPCVLRDLLSQQLAKQVGMDVEQLNRYVFHSGYNASNAATTDHVLPTVSSSTVKYSVIRQALALLLQHPHLVQQAQIEQDFSDIALPGVSVLCELMQALEQKPNLTTAALVERWRDRTEYPHLLRLAQSELMLPEKSLGTEFQATLVKIRQRWTEQLINRLMAKASSTELTAQEKRTLQQLLMER